MPNIKKFTMDGDSITFQAESDRKAVTVVGNKGGCIVDIDGDTFHLEEN